jgi:hypothetical protein
MGIAGSTPILARLSTTTNTISWGSSELRAVVTNFRESRFLGKGDMLFSVYRRAVEPEY